jgi:hypothetical protein
MVKRLLCDVGTPAPHGAGLKAGRLANGSEPAAEPCKGSEGTALLGGGENWSTDMCITYDKFVLTRFPRKILRLDHPKTALGLHLTGI